MADREQGACSDCSTVLNLVDGKVIEHLVVIQTPDPMAQVTWTCNGSLLPPLTCRVCGCTEVNCQKCIAKTGAPCAWVEEDLCSACTVQVDVNALSTDGTPNLNGDYFPDAHGLTRFGPDAETRREFNPIMGAAVDAYRDHRDAPSFTLPIGEVVPGKSTTTATLERTSGFAEMFGNLDEQRDGKDLIAGLAEMTGDPKLVAMAAAGMSGYLTRVEEVHQEIVATAAARWPRSGPSIAQARAAGDDVWGICPNCEQWQRPPHGDCVNDCAQRGFAVRATKPAEEFERQVLGQFVDFEKEDKR